MHTPDLRASNQRAERLRRAFRLPGRRVWLGLSSSLMCVTRFIFSTPVAAAMTSFVAVLILALWLALPLAHRAG